MTTEKLIGFEEQIAKVPTVWASPFDARAMAWREKALNNPEEVYPSVLLMKSIPSTKSGVMVTTDVVTGGEGLTASIAWGPGGAVDNESAETLVLRPDGTTFVATEAKAPYRRKLGTKGGIV